MVWNLYQKRDPLKIKWALEENKLNNREINHNLYLEIEKSLVYLYS